MVCLDRHAATACAYEFDGTDGRWRHWILLPEQRRAVGGIAFDAHDQVFVSCTERSAVAVCRLNNGAELRSFTTKHVGAPGALAINRQSLFVVFPSKALVGVFDCASGVLKCSWSTHFRPDMAFSPPLSIAVSPLTGEVFVSFPGAEFLPANQWRGIRVFDRDGVSRRRALEGAKLPRGIAFDRAGQLLVCDASIGCVCVLDAANGRLVCAFGHQDGADNRARRGDSLRR